MQNLIAAPPLSPQSRRSDTDDRGPASEDALGVTTMASLIGDGTPVPCLDGCERAYANLDCAASTSALAEVADRVAGFLPWYSSVHRGAGYKSQLSTAAYEAARQAVLRFA